MANPNSFTKLISPMPSSVNSSNMSPCSSPSPSLDLNEQGVATLDSSPKLNKLGAPTHDSDEGKSTGDSSDAKEKEEKFTESQNIEKCKIEANPTSRKRAEFDLNYPISRKRAKFDLNYPYLDLELGYGGVIFEYQSETTKTESDNAQYSRDVKVKAEVKKEYDAEDHLGLELGPPGLYSSRILSTTWIFRSSFDTLDEHGAIKEKKDTHEVVILD